ncbi:MAG: glycosyltransferase family 39 protein [Planctomycetota bacterium]
MTSPDAPHREGPRSTTRLLLVLFIIAVGIALRAYRAGAAPLWTDEFISYWVVENASPHDIALRSFRYTPCPPLYFYPLKASLDLFGKSEWAMRLPSLLFGSAFLVGAFFFVRKLFPFRIAALATGLLALNPLLIFESHNARMYSLGVLLVLGALYSFLEILRHERPRPLHLALYFLFALAAFYTHYLLISAIVFTNFFYLVRRRDLPQKAHLRLAPSPLPLTLTPQSSRLTPSLLAPWLAVNAALLAAFLPGLIALFARRPGLVGSEPLDLAALPQAVERLLTLKYVAVALLASLSVEYFLRGLQRVTWTLPEQHREDLAFVLFSFAATASVIFVAACLVDPILLWERYLIVSTFAGASLVAAFVGFLEPARLRTITALTLLGLLLFPRLIDLKDPGGVAFQERAAHQRGWRDALRQAEPLIARDDVLFVQGTTLEAIDSKDMIYSQDPTLERYLCAPALTFYLPKSPRLIPLPKNWNDEVFDKYYLDRFAEALDRPGAFWIACAREPYFWRLHLWLDAQKELGVWRTALVQSTGCSLARFERIPPQPPATSPSSPPGRESPR